MARPSSRAASNASSPVLEVPQTFEPATSYDVREDLAELMRRDLLGPWDGQEEEFRPRAAGPRERYLVGMLGPRRTFTSTGDVDEDASDLDPGAEGSADDTPGEQLTSQALGRLWVSSMGLSCTVPQEVASLRVRASWGRYAKRATTDEQGRPRTVWVRHPFVDTRDIPLDIHRHIRLGAGDTAEDDDTGVFLELQVREAPRGQGRRVVELALVNRLAEPPTNKDTAWLFQTELSVTAVDGDEAVFLPVDDPLDDADAPPGEFEDRHLRLLYRNVLVHGRGRNVAVHAEVREGDRRAWRLTTAWMPTFDVPPTVAPSLGGNPSASPPAARAELSMDVLAEISREAIQGALAPLANGYDSWLDDRSADVSSLPVPLRSTAEGAVFLARQAAARVRAGIDLLSSDDVALEAFRFANRAMALQRRHTEIGWVREDRGCSYAAAAAEVDSRGPVVASWRPFQLAFVLLNLPALADPAHAERRLGGDALVDLLFFPTGGGKTEAYLGLTAYTFAIRRLQGTVGSAGAARSGADGVAVLMRYTLRLLTAQQFQRAATLVCAAEVLRRQAIADGDHRWGSTPFRIGLWVGAAMSPNRFEEAAEQVDRAREAGGGTRVNALQTLVCPWCGEALAGQRDLDARRDLRRVLLYCPNGEGPNACPFSRLQADGEGLPILTIDEEIYRLVPALVIATVDKLAQLPWRGYAGLLFGRTRSWCPRHGYRHPDLDRITGCADRHNATPRLPAVRAEPVPQLRPPDLIIQDELHLLAGALGTVVGLFEGAVHALCSWSAPTQTGIVLTGPKIVASTATTKRSSEQVLRIFGRRLAVFPPPVLDVEDTFFSRQAVVSRDNPGRRYVGLCAHGVRVKAAEIRIAEILLLGGQTLFDRHGAPADPYMTVVGYFNAIRELAGMRRALDDQVVTRVKGNGARRGLSDRIHSRTGTLQIAELTSRISSADITTALKRLEVGFDPELDTSERRRATIAEVVAARRENRTALIPERRRDPADVVLATSMLQVGVDVARFGLMVVSGQPKNTAEYIQATSRVGRTAARPGLVVTLYNWARPRDLAHYESFEPYHATFYRQVEALSVTPYARRSLDRGATATFVAAVRHAQDAYSPNAAAQDVPLTGEVVQAIKGRLLERAELAADVRGRNYLEERLNALRDRWDLAKTGPTRLGYAAGSWNRQRLIGLLEETSGQGWTERTVAQSMRETEPEINLLLPGSGLFDQAFGEPTWTFGEPVADDEEDRDVGDELGETEPAVEGAG